MESSGGKKEVEVSAPENVGEVVFGAAEVEPRGESMAEVPVVQDQGKVIAVLPPMMQTSETKKDTGTKNDAPEVRRDAEQMPKEYARYVVGVMRKYRKDPERQQDAFTDLKWDYMGKAYGRDLGDGLDGRKAA